MIDLRNGDAETSSCSQRVSRLTFIRDHHTKEYVYTYCTKKVIYAEYDCSCGTRGFITCKSSVQRKNVLSCGCLNKEVACNRLPEMHKKNTLLTGEASFNKLYRRYKNDAKTRNRSFCITKEEFRILTKCKCYFCGLEPSSIMKGPGYNGDYLYNGLDRLDNTKDYELSNCVTCCKICNRAKQTMTIEEFKTHIIRAYLHLTK